MLFLVLCLVAGPGLFQPIEKGNHPIYISLLEMNPNFKDGTLECAMKLFSDDLELAVKKAQVNGAGSLSDSDAVWRYLSERFRCSSEQGPGVMEYLGTEGDPDAQWIYFQIRFRPHKLPREVEIQWATLLETYPGQRNILHLQTPQGIATFFFDIGRPNQTISLTK